MKQERYNAETEDTSVRNDHVRTTPTLSDDDMMPPGGIIMRKAVWCVFGFIISLVSLRLLLPILGFSATSDFASYIYGISSLFVVPFYTVMTPQPGYTNALIEINSLVAILVYGLIAWGLAKLMTVGSRINYV